MERDTKINWKKIEDEWKSPAGVVCTLALLMVLALLLIPSKKTENVSNALINDRLDSLTTQLNSLNTWTKFLFDTENKIQAMDKKEEVWASDKNFAEGAHVFMFDGCEYIRSTRGVFGLRSRIGYMAHKGNCKNPIHRTNVNKKLDSIYTEAQDKMKLINILRQ